MDLGDDAVARREEAVEGSDFADAGDDADAAAQQMPEQLPGRAVEGSDFADAGDDADAAAQQMPEQLPGRALMPLTGGAPAKGLQAPRAPEAALDESVVDLESAAVAADWSLCTTSKATTKESAAWGKSATAATTPSSYGHHGWGKAYYSDDEYCKEGDDTFEAHTSSTRKSKDVALHSKIKAFDDMRQEERLRMFNVVCRASTRLLTSGCLAAAARQVCRWLLSGYEALAVGIVAYLLLVSGLVIGSACPYDLLDFNRTSRQNPRTLTFMLFMMILISGGQLFYFPHLDGVEVLLCLGGIVSVWQRCCPSPWPKTTTFLSLYLIADQFNWGLIFLCSFANDMPMQATASAAIGSFNLITGVPILGLWLLRRWQAGRGGGSGPCMACYEVLYGWLLCLGIAVMTEGVTRYYFPRPGEGDEVKALLEFTRGAVIFTPAALVLILGRYRLFHLLGRSFDRDGARLRRDGAFVAELLDTVEVQVGQLWWIRREAEDEQYDAGDPRRNWQRGVVVEVGDESSAAAGFDVQLQEEARKQSLSDGGGSLMAALAGAGGGSLRRCHVELSQSASKSKEELLLEAQKNLRCVDFERLSPDLMKRVDSTKNPELQAAWHALSRPVNRGETIDYFMSNSWYDDPELKWQKLTEVAERFYKKNGRYPTFWLDKLCIDQTSVADGLKVLPVNVMACQKLLVMCGQTYLSRLWCIWELFTLFAFVSEQAALDRVEFCFLGDFDEGIEMLDDMKHFHVKDAHCYDPNEEARLLQVIDAVGTARFNKRISDLAGAALARLEQQRKKRFGRAVGMKTWSVTSTPSDAGAQEAPPALPDV